MYEIIHLVHNEIFMESVFFFLSYFNRDIQAEILRFLKILSVNSHMEKVNHLLEN